MTACLYPGCGRQVPCEAHPNYIHEEGPVAKSRRLEAELLKARADAAFERAMKLLLIERRREDDETIVRIVQSALDTPGTTAQIIERVRAGLVSWGDCGSCCAQETDEN